MGDRDRYITPILFCPHPGLYNLSKVSCAHILDCKVLVKSAVHTSWTVQYKYSQLCSHPGLCSLSIVSCAHILDFAI